MGALPQMESWQLRLRCQPCNAYRATITREALGDYANEDDAKAEVEGAVWFRLSGSWCIATPAFKERECHATN